MELAETNVIRDEERKQIAAILQGQQDTTVKRGESFSEIVHDARNMVAALGLYCDLLEQPGVLTRAFAHYGHELRQVALASFRLVEKISQSDSRIQPGSKVSERSASLAPERWPARLPGNTRMDVRRHGWDFLMPEAPVVNLAAEVLATRNLLASLAGPGIAVTVEADGGNRPARITAEDLTRVLVNLVRNSVEAMPKGGRIQVRLREDGSSDGGWLVLTVEDSGPGIAHEQLEKIFESGYSSGKEDSVGTSRSRGLGLGIARAIIEGAGGRMRAENRISGGARLVMELPAGR